MRKPVLTSIQCGRWLVSCDVEATRRAYTAVAQGSAEECGCNTCQNFAVQRARVYPATTLALFDSLGIQPDREAEVSHFARLESGLHFYGGWFHFMGSIVSGADAAKQISENRWQSDLENETEDFSLGFTSMTHLVRKPFEGFPLVQLEFNANIPWVLQTEEPR
jgi:hypothetical protein